MLTKRLKFALKGSGAISRLSCFTFLYTVITELKEQQWARSGSEVLK